jgi:Ninjurin
LFSNHITQFSFTQASNDLSNFVQKKSLAQGMMDLALVSANTNQLRYVIDMHDDHPYYLTSLALIIGSLILQVAVGMAMLYSSRFNIRKQSEMKSADRVNSLSTIGVFFITLINVLISTFNGSGAHPPAVAPPASNSTQCPVCPEFPMAADAAIYD